MTGKWTPGPWIWRWKSCSLHRPGPQNSLGGPTYAEAVLIPHYEYDSGIEFEISDADAALIAAAPDLYEALRRLVSAQDCGASESDPIHPDIWSNARAAIARAEGNEHG